MASNTGTRDRWPEYYYDLSKEHSSHLETPMWLQSGSVPDGLRLLATATRSLLTGQPFLRQLTEDPDAIPATAGKVPILTSSVTRWATTVNLSYITYDKKTRDQSCGRANALEYH